jgi:hypothetical protein
MVDVVKNDNDLILERMRGIPIQKADWKDKFHPQNPNVPQANDNEPKGRETVAIRPDLG